MEIVREASQEKPLGQIFFTPVLGGLMEHPVITRGITAAVALQCGLQSFGVTLWECPLHHLTGIPCPGCGLTRGCTCILHGAFGQAIAFHAFSPVFIVAMALLAFAAVAPKSWRVKASTAVASAERRTGVTSMLLILFVAYWLARLLFLGPGYSN